jgi:16S rRNA G966 N2-methylase RsmD
MKTFNINLINMDKISLVQSVILPLSRLEVNKGQISSVPKNPRFIRDDRYKKLKGSIQEDPEMLALRELLVFEHAGKYVIIGGNMRYRALKELGYTETVCKIMPSETPIEKIKAITIKDNSGFGEWDFDMLANEWDIEDLNKWGVDMDFLKDDSGDADNKAQEKQIQKLVETFIIPPFSVLNTRSKEWQERRKQWIDLGIKSELGRMGNITYSATAQPPIYYQTKNILKKRLNRIPTHEEIVEELESKGFKTQSGVSIFDPVLTEISYRWFNIKNGTVLDPFAGGSVRGIIAAKLGMPYVGNDLRKEQIESNRENAKIVLYDLDVKYHPVWTSGDSLQIDEILKKENIKSPFDMIFSCPPYADLEVYSDDKCDLSNMEYRHFLKIYREIIKKSCSLLKENRFAVFTVGDVRDKSGVYRNFVGDTIQAFTDCGLKYYNHFILVNQINSLAIRVRRQFNNSRKAGKTHQNVLAFFKGEPGEMPDTFEKINIKKAIERFNTSKEATEITEDVVCFYKGDLREINKHFHSFDDAHVTPIQIQNNTDTNAESESR